MGFSALSHQTWVIGTDKKQPTMKNHHMTTPFLTGCAFLAAVVFISGCASDKGAGSAQPNSAAAATSQDKVAYKNRQYAANPSKVKFSEFKAVELKATTLNAQENNE